MLPASFCCLNAKYRLIVGTLVFCLLVFLIDVLVYSEKPGNYASISKKSRPTREKEPGEIDPEKNSDFIVRNRLHPGNQDWAIIAKIRNGKLIYYMEGSPEYIGDRYEYYYDNGQLCGYVERSKGIYTNADRGVPFGWACLEDFSVFRYPVKAGRIIGCIDKYGKAVRFSYEELVRKEMIMVAKAADNQKRVLEFLKNSESFSFWPLEPGSDLFYTISSMLAYGNIEGTEPLIGSFCLELTDSRQFETICCQAIESGNMQLVDRLLKARPEVIKTFSEEPLRYAAWYGYPEAVKALLQGSIKFATESGSSFEEDWAAVGFAAENGHIEVFDLLLAANHTWKSSRVLGRICNMALRHAVIYGRDLFLAHLITQNFLENLDESELRSLVEKTAEKRRENKFKFTSDKKLISDYLADEEMNRARCLKLILDAKKMPVEFLHGAFKLAIAYRQQHILKVLLDNQISPDLRLEFGMTPLMKIFSRWNRDQSLDYEIAIVELLINYGADINAVDSNGRSVLEHAVMLGRSPLFEKILTQTGQEKAAQIKAFTAAAVDESFSAMERISEIPGFVLTEDGRPALQKCLELQKTRSLDWFLRRGIIASSLPTIEK